MYENFMVKIFIDCLYDGSISGFHSVSVEIMQVMPCLGVFRIVQIEAETGHLYHSIYTPPVYISYPVLRYGRYLLNLNPLYSFSDRFGMAACCMGVACFCCICYIENTPCSAVCI